MGGKISKWTEDLKLEVSHAEISDFFSIQKTPDMLYSSMDSADES